MILNRWFFNDLILPDKSSNCLYNWRDLFDHLET
jgi:hypothetical protein